MGLSLFPTHHLRRRLVISELRGFANDNIKSTEDIFVIGSVAFAVVAFCVLAIVVFCCKARRVSDGKYAEGHVEMTDDERIQRQRYIENNLSLARNVKKMPFCSICLEDFGKNEKAAFSKNPDCDHVFHRECITNWLITHKECPLCQNVFFRRDLDECRRTRSR
mmetsp:Transcript_22248/g.31000  ORF Transcript_22248/g.31000 Transcript_22248/m.31000 type:complete len:164 (+) Transcript_22248:70-561(+)